MNVQGGVKEMTGTTTNLQPGEARQLARRLYIAAREAEKMLAVDVPKP